MIHPGQLRKYVVEPALRDIGMYTKVAEDLVMGTAAQESKCGHYLHQLGGGPALGIFQMEPFTHNDIWKNFIAARPVLKQDLSTMISGRHPNPEEMIWNLKYAASMCRIHYKRFPEPLPAKGDIQGLAELWKKRYNTEMGAGTVEEFLKNYEFVAESV